MADVMQKDLVLAPNEYAFVLDETKGNVSCNVGPHKMSLSQSDKLVYFDAKRKKFKQVEKYSEAIQLFVVAPEGWYIALKNPAPNNNHPRPGVSNTIPNDMMTGCKVMIPGPASFALYPGQMAQVIKGHTLRSNQYLLARVYDADALNGKNCDLCCDDANNPTQDCKECKTKENYVNGQILVIKGTEVSFYIPPTGIEVIPIKNNEKEGYVRDAITLERLEYCILKDEDGNKRYVHGPEVVFPEPTESFIQDGHGNIRRNAIELSDISGVYVKVIADYEDEKGVKHKTGEELFITGKDQMIYYPRPEHTFISYNGKIVHHAVAIPKGEGRYVMDRTTGEIRTVRGPAMYLPDPRTEVGIKRTLTRNQCALWYPNNAEVLQANGHNLTRGTSYDFDTAATVNTVATFADCTMQSPEMQSYTGIPTTKALNKINRSNTFTQPRTISLDTSKYEGAVAIDIWTGHAVNLISKDGTREVICGPRTILLDYDQTLEVLELSTGKPKTTDKTKKQVFLRHENNHISDIIEVETKDFVTASVKVSYHVSFDINSIDKWFAVDNYVKHLCDWARAHIKRAVKEYTVAEFHEMYQDIVTEAITTENGDCLHFFTENGMFISGIEVLSLAIESHIQKLIDTHQEKIIEQALELTAAESAAKIDAQIVELNRAKVRLTEDYAKFKMEEEHETELRMIALDSIEKKAKEAEINRKLAAEAELEELRVMIEETKREDRRKNKEMEMEFLQRQKEIESQSEAASAASMVKVLEAIGPDLAAALNSENNQEVVKAIASAISPYAIARGDSISDAVNKMVRGTTMETVMESFKKNSY